MSNCHRSSGSWHFMAIWSTHINSWSNWDSLRFQAMTSPRSFWHLAKLGDSRIACCVHRTEVLITLKCHTCGRSNLSSWLSETRPSEKTASYNLSRIYAAYFTIKSDSRTHHRKGKKDLKASHRWKCGTGHSLEEKVPPGCLFWYIMI